MADLDGIRRQDEEISEANRLAVAGLAGYLQDAVRMLPQESIQCRAFYKCSESFADIAGYPTGLECSGALALMSMEMELRRLDIGGDA
jgi:hypothetical protein